MKKTVTRLLPIAWLATCFTPFQLTHAELSVSEQIQQIYIGYLGRAADADGLAYWTNEVNQGLITVDQIRINIVNEQPEYLENYGQLTYPELAIAVYQNLLNREPDQAGLDYWVNELDTGSIAPEDLIIAYINGISSEEDEAIMENKLTVAECYTGNPDIYSEDDIEIIISALDSSDSYAQCPPVADAGEDQTVEDNTIVMLSGSGQDVEGGLSFAWEQTDGLSVSLTDAMEMTASFTTPNLNLDQTDTLIFTLTVTDDAGAISLDMVAVTVTGTEDPLVNTYKIVDTNQTTCFNSNTGNTTSCNGSGQDADYSGNQPSYTVSNSGLTVSDNVTGLVWTQTPDLDGDGDVTADDKLTQGEAVSYCNNLNLDGRSDWRLPSIKESYSLILFSGKDPSNYTGTDTSGLSLFIDDSFQRAFGDTASGERIIDGQYASTTLYVSTTMNNDPTMFGVNFVDGRIKGYPYERQDFYVLCVAGNEDYGTNEYLDNGDETVSDLATGLMWQQNDSLATDWEDALDQCESAGTGAHNDWRLPNVKELQSLVDYSRSPDTDGSAAIDPIFNATSFLNEESITDWGFYWSSTTHVNSQDDGSNGAYVSFGRALGYMNSQILDVHGAGAQRSNDKLDVSTEPGASSATVNGTFYYKGPQGDILRNENMVRCVRDI